MFFAPNLIKKKKKKKESLYCVCLVFFSLFFCLRERVRVVLVVVWNCPKQIRALLINCFLLEQCVQDEQMNLEFHFVCSQGELNVFFCQSICQKLRVPFQSGGCIRRASFFLSVYTKILLEKLVQLFFYSYIVRSF
jgi:hypothetical protein